MKEEIENKKETSYYDLVEVPTQYGLAFKDNQTNELLDNNQLLLKIANDVSVIKKSLTSM